MKISQANIIGDELATLIQSGDIDGASIKIDPILNRKTPFSSLNRIGAIVGRCSLEQVNPFLARIARDKTMGGWVVIGSALGEQLERDFSGAFIRSREYIVLGDEWYSTDIIGERVPGPGLVHDFYRGISELTNWRDDPNRWVRRAVGVSVHFWAKKSKGDDNYARFVEELLELLIPMFSEWNMDAVKGIGWGIKTLGKHYPNQVTVWLEALLGDPQLHYRAIMLRKATTYLGDAQKERIKSMIT